jgi:protein-disulfide isomerase
MYQAFPIEIPCPHCQKGKTWLTVVDKVTVATDGKITFTFRNGAEVTA